VAATTSLPPAVEVPEPSQKVGVSGPPPTAEVAETSSARVALTAEEVMELAMCRYIDFPSVGVIDLEAPQLLEKVYEVASEWMFNEPMIMETIASVSKALQEDERDGGFAPAVATEVAGAVLEAPATYGELTADISARQQPSKVGTCRSPSRRKPLKLQPPLQRLARQRPLLRMRDHRRPD
jgi:hypothetical protein